MAGSGKQKRNRSPEHPSIGLETAIEKARDFFEKEHYGFANKATALKHWGYSPKSSSGLRILAALLHFGLLEEKGTGDDRRVRLSEWGKILADEDSPEERQRAVRRKAALKPPIYMKLWEAWSPNGHLPSESTMKWELKNEYGFNPKAIDGFIEDFKSTLELANLLHDDTLSGESGASHEEEPDNGGGPGQGEKGNPPGEERAMPSTGTSDKRDWDLTIPLVEGGQAVLRIPIPVTEEDFDLLKGVIGSNLDAMKKAIVRTPQAPEEDDDSGD